MCGCGCSIFILHFFLMTNCWTLGQDALEAAMPKCLPSPNQAPLESWGCGPFSKTYRDGAKPSAATRLCCWCSLPGGGRGRHPGRPLLRRGTLLLFFSTTRRGGGLPFSAARPYRSHPHPLLIPCPSFRQRPHRLVARPCNSRRRLCIDRSLRPPTPVS